MAGSNDWGVRKQVFAWLAAHERTFYSPRQPIRPIGVYFSPSTRNSFPDEFIRSYRGMMCLLLQSHREFEVVTPRSLASFSGSLLILPDVKCVSAAELAFLRTFMKSGRALWITGETAKFDEEHKPQREMSLYKQLGIENSGLKQNSRFIYDPECPGRKYYDALNKEFNDYSRRTDYQNASFNGLRQELLQKLDRLSPHESGVEIEASPFVSTQIASVAGEPTVFIANFRGLKPNEVAESTAERDVRVSFTAKARGRVYLLPFLGQVRELRCTPEVGRLVCTIPELGKGAVVWLEQGH